MEIYGIPSSQLITSVGLNFIGSGALILLLEIFFWGGGEFNTSVQQLKQLEENKIKLPSVLLK